MVYLKTTYELCFGETYFEYFESCDFSPRKYKYRCICVYVWFKDDKHVIWMWIWLILKNISLLDRIWSLWLVRFTHSPPNFIFCLGRPIFSVSINSHPDNIYISARFKSYLRWWCYRKWRHRKRPWPEVTEVTWPEVIGSEVTSLRYALRMPGFFPVLFSVTFFSVSRAFFLQ